MARATRNLAALFESEPTMRRAAAVLTPSLLALACVGSPPAEPLAQPTSIPAVFVERHGPAPAGMIDHGPACPVELADAPTPLFDDRVLLRLPGGLDETLLRSDNLEFARTKAPAGMGCAPGQAASIIVASQRKPEASPLARWREAWFATLNYPAERELSRLSGSDQHGDVSFVLGFPDHPVWGTTRIYVRMFERFGRVHAVAFATDARDFHALLPIFEASAQTMVAVPD